LKLKVESKDDYFEPATVDMVDGKMAAMLEKLKNDNQMIWKSSLEQAEKVFSKTGISDTIDLLPN